jgi:hypothetical protein
VLRFGIGLTALLHPGRRRRGASGAGPAARSRPVSLASVGRSLRWRRARVTAALRIRSRDLRLAASLRLRPVGEAGELLLPGLPARPPGGRR